MRADNSLLAAPLCGLLALCALFAALLITAFSPPSAQAALCPNEAIRAEQGSAALALPDCRAYELVSPGSIPSLTADTQVGMGGGKASPGGDVLSYYSVYPAEGSQVSNETWLSKRGASAWSIEGVEPQMTPSPSSNGDCLPGVAFSEQLDTHLLSAGGEIDIAESPPSPFGECGMPLEELAPGEPRGYSNLFLRRGDGPYVLVNPVPVGGSPGNATYQAASTDLSRVVFSENSQLTPGSPVGHNLFVWVEGVVRFVGVLPTGEPVTARLGAATRNWGSSIGPPAGLAPVSNAVSDNGERIFFEANGNLYLRENAGQPPAADPNCVTTTEPDLACTLQIDWSFGANPPGGGVFQFASRDGSKVFFTSDHKLTYPASAQPGRPDLYEYDVDSREIKNLTVPSSGVANVRGISGGSDDGSRLYFVARGILTGPEQNKQGEEAQLDQPNLYLAQEGALTYVATLSPWEEGPQLGGQDRGNWWESDRGNLRTAWSPSGRYLLFSSFKSLTGFDNTPAEPGLCVDAEGGPPCQELFLYDADAAELSCVSCDPGGARPIVHTALTERQEFRRFVPGPRYLPRAVLDSGQVFFDTGNPLLPRDVNKVKDVYEFRSGNLSLISSGTAEGGSAFIDASADGRNVFFANPAALVRSDDDGGLLSIYDARVDGGFAEPPLPPAPCAGEGCRPPGPPPPAGSPPSTAAFAGRGNVKPRQCKRGQVRRAGRCVKKGKRQHRKQRSGSHRSGRKN